MPTADQQQPSVPNPLDQIYRDAFMAMNQGVSLLDIQFDEQGKAYDVIIRDANPAQSRIDGVQALIGKRVKEFLPNLELKWIERYAGVARSGQSAHFEDWSEATQRWYEVEASSVGGAGSSLVVIIYNDITQRRQLEDAWQQSQALNAFLLQLSDALRSLANPIEIEATAARQLGEHLGANQVHYGETIGDDVVIHRGYGNGLPPMVGRFNSLDFGQKLTNTYRAGRVQVVEDVETDASTTEAERQVLRAAHIGAYITVPLIKKSQWVATLAVHSISPRAWTTQQVESVKETAERTWAALERARAEAVLAESELNYRTLFNGMDEGYAIIDVLLDDAGKPNDYRVLEVNPQLERLTGLSNEAFSAGKSIRELIPDLDDHWIQRYGHVALSGEPIRFEDHQQTPNRWYDIYAFRVGDPERRRVAIFYNEITERKRREANGTFLADIMEAFAQVSSINDIMQAVGATIGRYMNVVSCVFADVDETKENQLSVSHAWVNTGTPFIVGDGYRLEEHIKPAVERAMRADETFVVNDTQTDPRTDAKGYAAAQIGAFVVVPFHRDGQWRHYLTVYDNKARDWRDDEIELFRELADRIFPRLDRARAELAVLDSQARLQKAIQIDTVGVIFFDNAGNFLEANDAFLTMTGYTREQFDRQPLTTEDITMPEWMPRTQQALEELKTKGLATPYEKQFKRPDGSRWWGLTASTNLSAHENVEYLIDVTNRKKAEKELRTSEARFRTLTDAVPQVIWTNDAGGTASYFNQRWYAYSGLTKAESVGLGWQAIVHPEDAPASVARWQQALAAGTVFDTEYRLRRSDGVYRWFIGRNVPLRDEPGTVLGWFGSATDIEEMKQAQEALRLADRRKDEFLAMLAHELRNPLAPIRNVLQVLQLTSEADESVGPAVAMMGRQVDQLVRLIDDLLDVSRISRGKIDLHRERIDLATVVRQAVEAVRPLYDVGGRVLSVHLPSSPVNLLGDAARLTQVVTNLLTNGARYTLTEGHVWLTVEQADHHVRLSVRDNGIGIAPDQLAAVFELFVQVDNSLARSQGGLGLGLTLVKKLVELHGGQVEARSDGLGEGSEFVITLPVYPQQDQPVPAKTEPAFAPTPGHRILVVDDNRDAADTLAMLLTLKKHKVQVRYGGREAVTAAEREQPEVVLLDIGMPELDGYQTCRLIRKGPVGKNMVLIALTGYGQAEDIRQSQEAGFDGHLTKPIDLAALTGLLDELLPNG